MGDAATGYLRGLDGLRALAVVAVVAYHFGLPGARGGFLGVDAFFVVSGFLVTRLLSDELATSGRVDIGPFWVRRLRRLLPALFAMLAAAAVVYGYRIPEKLRSGRLDLAAGAVFAGNWRMIASSTSYFDQLGRPPLTRHLWSLGIEGQFYALWPVVVVALAYVAAGDRRRMAILTVLLGVLSMTWCAAAYRPETDPSRVYFGTDTRLVGILFGAALALFLAARRPNAPARRPSMFVNLAGVGALAVFVVATVAVRDRDALLYRGGFGVIALIVTIVVWSTTIAGSWLERSLAVAPLRWIGVRSYSLYLWHWPVVALSQPGVDVPVEVNRWVLAGGRLIVSLLLTELSFRLIEEPFRRRLFGRWLSSLGGRGARRRSPRWYGGTLAAAVVVAGAASGVSRASQNDGIADSLRNPTDELVVASGTGGSLASTTIPAPAVITPSSVVPTTFPPPPPNPKLPVPTLAPKAGAPGVAMPIVPTTMPRPPAVLAIGDSIMKGAAPSLSTRLGDGSVIDAAVSRPFTAGVKVYDAQTAKHPPFGAVVVHLGNNGVPSRKQFAALLDAVGPQLPVVFVTMRESREWAPKLNSLLREEALTHPNMRVLEWNVAAGDNEYLFAKDKLHLTGTGGRYYSDLIVWALAQAGYAGVAPPTTVVPTTVAPTTRVPVVTSTSTIVVPTTPITSTTLVPTPLTTVAPTTVAQESTTAPA